MRPLRFIRKAVLSLTLAFTAAVGGAGVDMGVRLARQDSQPLTTEQIDKARSVFGDDIDYSKVRISFDKVSYFQPSDVTVTIGNTIHYPPARNPARTEAQRRRDAKPPIIVVSYMPSKGNTADLFIHEMTHIWQNQHHIKNTGIPGAIGLWIRSVSASNENVYAFQVDGTRDFLGYNIEQQGDIVATYYMMKKNLAENPAQAPSPEYLILRDMVEKNVCPVNTCRTPPAAPKP